MTAAHSQDHVLAALIGMIVGFLLGYVFARESPVAPARSTPPVPHPRSLEATRP